MKTAFAVAIILFLCLPAPAPAQGIADLVKMGKVQLVADAKVSDNKLPENAFFQNPRCLAADAKGNIDVSDADAKHIKVFGPDGKFRTTLSRKGEGPGEIQMPTMLGISVERLVVWEAMNRRFSILDLKGGFIKTAKAVYGGTGDLLALRALSDGRWIAFVERGLPAQFQGRLPEERDYAVLLLSTDLTPVSTIDERKFRNRRWTRHPQTQGLIQVPFPYHPGVKVAVSPDGTIAIGTGRTYEIGLYDPDKGRRADHQPPVRPAQARGPGQGSPFRHVHHERLHRRTKESRS
jgi:hypothetical protein